MVCGLCLIFPLIAYPQQQKISVTIRNLSLKQAMEQISKQAEMNVAYSKEFESSKCEIRGCPFFFIERNEYWFPFFGQ